jgi:4-hydroxy-tetrahydrodipicolinate synthase
MDFAKPRRRMPMTRASGALIERLEALAERERNGSQETETSV